MKRIVVLAEDKWSMGRVHHDVAFHLAKDFEFCFHDACSFYVHDFVKDFHASDLCLTTTGCLETTLRICNLESPRYQQKFVAVCHGFEGLDTQIWPPHVTFGTVSDVLLPHIPINLHVVPNGVNDSLFERKMHSGNVKLLGWCGGLHNPAKLSHTIFEIADASHLAVSIAQSLTLEDLKEWYHSIDVLLVTSGPEPHFETGPLPPFEAIASGVVVIGTRVGNFLKVPGPKFQTVQEAALILSDLKANPVKVRQLAQEQYCWVMENWTYRTLSAAWKEMFECAIANQTKFLDFVEVGTSDFDTEIEKADNKVGVSIEPIKHYLDRLPDKQGCTKLNIGVSDYTGTCDVNFVSESTIRELGFPDWVKGCNCINSYHKTVAAMCLEKSIDIAAVTTTETVPVRTLFQVMQDLMFDGLYLLKIDTEGHDAVILKKFVQEFNGDRRLLPHVIQFESNVLTSAEDVDEIVLLFETLGYDLLQKAHDTVLQRNLQKEAKNTFSARIGSYYIMDTPPNYSTASHANTLAAAKEYCVQNRCSGITYQDGKYQVRSGKYLRYTDIAVASWVHI